MPRAQPGPWMQRMLRNRAIERVEQAVPIGERDGEAGNPGATIDPDTSRGQPVELELYGRLRAGRRAAVIDEDDHQVRSDLGRMQEHHVPLAFAGFSGSEVDGAQNREAGHEKQGRPRTLPNRRSHRIRSSVTPTMRN